MAFVLTQTGYLGSAGPIFTADAGNGKKHIFIYETQLGVTGLWIKEPAYAANIGLTASDYTLGSYAGNQRFDQVPSFVQPSNINFSGYDTNLTAMTSGTTVPSTGTTTGGTTTGGTTTGGTTTGGTTTGGTNTTPTYAAPTLMEQISTFLTNYWWLVLLIVVFLLWKPIIAPALGFGKKKRR